MTEIVGRECELAAIRALLDDALRGPRLLIFEGEAGIGKTALWRAAIEEAGSHGFRVLISRPAEAERGFAHVGLADLFEPLRDEVLPLLPAPRRRALEVALLLDDPGPVNEADPRALGVAIADALRSLAREAPSLIAIDDIQWFDASSCDTLAFALRRLSDDRLGIVCTRRAGTEVRQQTAFESTLPEERTRRMTLKPLSVGALHRLLSERLARPFARQTLLRIYEHSGGNPFYALELARALEADVDPLHPLRIPHTLEELVRARLTGLPAETREALTLLAAAGPVADATLEQAGVVLATLEPAFAAGILERVNDTVRFAHPLLSSVVYAVSAYERERLHARLAGVVSDPLVRARHLALSTRRPDRAVAAALDDAATLAAARGAAQVAAELCEQALRLTPADARDERHRRSLAAARAQCAAGEWTRSRAIAERLLEEPDAGPLRVETLMLLAELASVDDAVALLKQALAESAAQPGLQAVIQCRLAWASRFRQGYPAALAHARTALELADDLDDAGLRRRAQTVHSILSWIAGREDTPPVTVDDLDLADVLGGERLVQEATLALVNPGDRAGLFDVRAALEREYEQWRDRDEPRAARSAWCLAWIELWAGRLELAAAYADQAYDVSRQYGLEVPQDHLPIALVALRRGRIELARTHSERALELAMTQFGLHPPQHVAVLALAAARSGDLEVAAAGLSEAERRAASLGWGEPTIRWWNDDRVEILLELGRVDEAMRVLDSWESDATRLARGWVLAHVRRCRGLLAAARGDVEQAIADLDAAVAEHETAGDPFGRGRALLALGSIRRRNRQKLPARAAIEAAVRQFEAIGAESWAASARRELGRIGGRTRLEGLSAAERRVADLVVQGRTNREIASALFLAERTVASHLTHIYAKLGVRSRTELAHRLHRREPA